MPTPLHDPRVMTAHNTSHKGLKIRRQTYLPIHHATIPHQAQS